MNPLPAFLAIGSTVQPETGARPDAFYECFVCGQVNKGRHTCGKHTAFKPMTAGEKRWSAWWLTLCALIALGWWLR